MTLSTVLRDYTRAETEDVNSFMTTDESAGDEEPKARSTPV